MLRFDVFGREIGVVRQDGAWRAVFVGKEGKHRTAPGVTIPPDLPASDLARFLADLFHEAARPDRPEVTALDPTPAAPRDERSSRE